VRFVNFVRQTVQTRQMERPVNWGILSAGLIAGDFARALALNCPNAVVYAVGARSQERADEFGDKFGVKVRYSSYEALAEDPNVGMAFILLCSPLSTSLSDRYYLRWNYSPTSQGGGGPRSKEWYADDVSSCIVVSSLRKGCSL
jgi:hypothetical protein